MVTQFINTVYLFALLSIFAFPAHSAPPLTITPDLVYAQAGSTLKLNASGGSGSYLWSSEEQTLQSNGANATFTVPGQNVYHLWVSDGEHFAWSVVDATQQDDIVFIRIIPENVKLIPQGVRGISVRGYTRSGREEDLSIQAQLSVADSAVAVLDGKMLRAMTTGQTSLNATYRNLNHSVNITVEQGVQMLLTEPAALVIDAGNSSGLQVFLRDADGAKNQIDHAQISVTDDSIATYAAGQVYGVSPGITELLVQVDNTSLPVPVTVRPSPPLGITPARAVTNEQTGIGFTLVGGKAPYQFSASEGTLLQQNEDMYFYQPIATGTKTLIVTDSLGTTNTAIVTVVKPLQAIPAQAALQAGESLQLEASGGGDGQYTWVATQGTLSALTGTKVTYTAPSGIGLHSVIVRDDLGQTLEIPLVVSDAVRLSPSILFLQPKQQSTITVVGGTPPFSLLAGAGQAWMEGQTLQYTAPPVAGEYALTLRDAKGNSVTANITVSQDLLISPQTIVLDAKATRKLHASGGIGTLHWKATRGKFSDSTGESVTYTAPQVFGFDVLHVYDSAGNIAVAQAHVTQQDIVITPAIQRIHPESNASFSVIGGTPPYRWTVDSGDIIDHGSMVDYTAPQQRGVYTITVSDNTQKQAKAQAQVYRAELLASPRTLFLGRGENAIITYAAGNGDYTAWASMGKVQLTDPENGQGQYTAPDYYEGIDSIYIEDSAGNLAVIRVEITRQDEILAMYTGPDGIIQDWEMEKALNDFFAGQAWLDKLMMYRLLEQYVSVAK